jgi:hypothetical protein
MFSTLKVYSLIQNPKKLSENQINQSERKFSQKHQV